MHFTAAPLHLSSQVKAVAQVLSDPRSDSEALQNPEEHARSALQCEPAHLLEPDHPAGEGGAEPPDEGMGEDLGEEADHHEEHEESQLPWLRDRPGGTVPKNAPLPQALAQRLKLDPSQLYSLHSSLFGTPQPSPEAPQLGYSQRPQGSLSVQEGLPRQGFGSPGVEASDFRQPDRQQHFQQQQSQQQQQSKQPARSPAEGLAQPIWQPVSADEPGLSSAGGWADAQPAITACSGQWLHCTPAGTAGMMAATWRLLCFPCTCI